MGASWSLFRSRGSLCSLAIALVASLPALLLLFDESNAWSVLNPRGGRRRRVVGRDATKLLSSKCRSGFPELSSIVVASSNTTYDHSITSAFREGVEALSFVEEGARSRFLSSPLERATEQVHALFDLCIESSADNLAYVSNDVALNALEGLVSRTLKDLENDNDSSAGCWPTNIQLELLETLTQRVDEVNESPSLRTVESLWMIYQYSWDRKLRQAQHVSQSKAATEHVRRTVQLLHSWLRWSEQPHTVLSGHSPPMLFLLKAMQTATQHRVNMSEPLWSLYSEIFQQNTKNETIRTCREVHTHLLEMLVYSGKQWDTRQCQVLQNMVVAARSGGLLQVHPPSVSDLMRALEASCSEGRVPDAAWLSRTILKNTVELNSTISENVRLHFLDSLLNCREPGSLLYMEQLLLDWTKDERISVTMSMVRKLLQRCSTFRAPGAGARAERNFYRMLQSNLTDVWQPDAECVYCVELAYLQEHTFTLSHVRKADKFVRKCVRTYGLHNNVSHSNAVCASAEWRVFESLLDGYGSAAFNETESRKALSAADELFRFFLVQHRDGRVTAEEPDHRHLERIVRLWKRRPTNSAADDTVGSDKCREYLHLMQILYQRGRIQSNPDTATIQRLLN